MISSRQSGMALHTSGMGPETSHANSLGIDPANLKAAFAQCECSQAPGNKVIPSRSPDP